jgi:UDP-N-acetylmuramoyl-tripeptide--D-alanyl-D-alanine ligase
LIGVDDPLQALQRLALYHRTQLAPTVVGITGSVGKTSTKEVVAAVLRRRFCTLKTRYSYNSEASLPTVVLQLTPEHEVAVMELGMWAPGEIRLLASLCLPRIGVVTNIGPSHLERMGTMEAITDAKAELVEALPPDGVAVLNGDDERVRGLAARTQARVFTYGRTPGVDLQAETVISQGMQGVACVLRYQGDQISLTLPLVGQHNIWAALAAAAVGLVLGLSWDEIIAGLQDTETSTRIQFIEAYQSTVIDDTYNASPVSVVAALDLLAEIEGYRIAVLGDMLELGSVEEEAHRLVGQRAAQVADHLICLGHRSHTWTADAAARAGMKQESIHCADQLDHVVTLLRTLIDAVVDRGQAEDAPRPIILVKGSRGLAMEKIVHSLGT